MLNHKVEGTGHPLLMIHGFGISFHIWEALSPLLRGHFRLIQIELPGIGSSPLPEKGRDYLEVAAIGIEQVRMALGIEHWHVLSYSSGTRVGEYYLNCHTDRVDQAVFICPVQLSTGKALSLRLALRLDGFFPGMGTWILSGSRLHYLIEYLGFNSRKDERSRRWFAEIGSQPVEILKQTLRSLPDGGGRPFMIPDRGALFIWADEDRIVQVPALSDRDRLIHADHSAAQTSAPPLAELIIAFLTGM
jgi:pimeloyl-ACP methyl ester carboxylesterase